MKKYLLSGLSILSVLMITACGENNTTPLKYPVTLTFSHLVTHQGLETGVIKYINAAGNEFSVEKLQYIVSEIQLLRSDGQEVSLTEGYHFIDISKNDTFSFLADQNIEWGAYEGISMVFGLREDKNLSGQYPDLNALSWSWPEMLGGGYHFMKLEGRFINAQGNIATYTTHMGTAREITVTDTLFHDNSALLSLGCPEFTLQSPVEINIEMDIAQWYDNPHSWNLDTLSNMIMPLFHAQQTLRDNAHDVFSIGEITTN
ncbi:MAG: hypothetical protein OEY51_11355 [Cyclobacteriaceae bacterium]|nr:hypothetical protein [Cyclobacteriaceae bacterium]